MFETFAGQPLVQVDEFTRKILPAMEIRSLTMCVITGFIPVDEADAGLDSKSHV
jgi:hypothetical protein